MNQSLNQKRRKLGFTLTELIVVIVIIGVLAAVLIPTISGYVDKAKNSNDVSLVRNMNSAILLAEDNDLATAENIRTLLKEQGIDDFKTNNSKNIIMFNSITKRFELKTSSDITTTIATIMVYAEGETFKVNSNPLTLENVYENYLIISTKGNALAEAISDLHNLSETTNVSSTLNKISDESVKSVVQDYLKASAFISATGTVLAVNDDLSVTTEVSGKTKVVVSENVTTISLAVLNSCLQPSAMIVIPNHITTVETTSFTATSAIISGNISALDKTSNLQVYENIQTAVGKVYVPVSSFDDLKAKISAGYKQLYLSGNIEVNGLYTIPKDVVINMPYMQGEYEISKKLYSNAEGASFENEFGSKPGYTLTISEGSTLTVEGTLNVGGVTRSFNDSPFHYQSMLYKTNYSSIIMSDNAKLVVEGTLMTIGKVTGTGSIEVTSTGAVRDRLQINNWRGGSYAYACFNGGYFPFTNYSFDSIEVPMSIVKGGTWTVFASIKMTITLDIEVGFVGEDGLFKLDTNGKFVKEQNNNSAEITNDDRSTFNFYGGMSDNVLTISASSMNIQSDEFVLPIGNITFNFISGNSSLENTSFKFLPGSVLNVNEGATLTVGSTIAIYDDKWEDLSSFSKLYPDTIYPTGRASANVTISGTLELKDGSHFGGEIKLTSTGKLTISENANTASITKETTKKTGKYVSSKITEYQKVYKQLYVIASTGAQIDLSIPSNTNGNYIYGLYSSNITSEANKYNLEEDHILKEDVNLYPFNTAKSYTIYLSPNEGTIEEKLTAEANGTYAYTYISGTKLPVAYKIAQDFNGWSTEIDNPATIVTEVNDSKITLYANFKIKTFDVKLYLQGAKLTAEYLEKLEAVTQQVSNIVYVEGDYLSFTFYGSDDFDLPTTSDLDFKGTYYNELSKWSDPNNEDSLAYITILKHAGATYGDTELEFSATYTYGTVPYTCHYTNEFSVQPTPAMIGAPLPSLYTKDGIAYYVQRWYYFTSENEKVYTDVTVIDPIDSNKYIVDYYAEAIEINKANIISYDTNKKEWSATIDEIKDINADIKYEWSCNIYYEIELEFIPGMPELISASTPYLIDIESNILEYKDYYNCAKTNVESYIDSGSTKSYVESVNCKMTITFESGTEIIIEATSTEGIDLSL